MSTDTTDFFDPLVDELPSRYVVGIDLGTTNSAVTYIDTDQHDWEIQVLLIPQYVSASEHESLETLPSFHYQPVVGETTSSGKTASVDKFFVGAFARDETAKTNRRGISSAKSWLCHAAVDRSAPLLPWHAADDVQRLSPVEVSAAYLGHIRHAWDRQFPDFPLDRQDIVLTLPASFDEVARELTIEAAAKAGLPRIVLIEEPQAAFYAWVYKHTHDWDQRVAVGQKILVCDIGGGTTDFTLIRVRGSKLPSDSGEVKNESNADSTENIERSHNDATSASRVQFHRVAVGNHLILGGDNLDLAVAKYIEQKLTGDGKLEPYQWDVLVGQSRNVKERMMSDNALDSMQINLPGRGSTLIGGSLQTEVTQSEIRSLLTDGFLPMVELTDKPNQLQSGFQEFGLPYASDPAITRYLAQFLVAHADAGSETDEAELDIPLARRARPDVILFNGGFFDSTVFRQRIVEQLCHWFSQDDETDWKPVVLDNDRLDLAVARGAAYYGMVRRDQGVRIAATLARSFYIAIGGDPPQAICIMPGSAEPGQTFLLDDQTFRLTVSQPVEFQLYVSSIRLADQVGSTLVIDPEQLTALPPIRTVLKTRSRNEKTELPVKLKIGLTELGTIDLSCQQIDSDRSWKLQFDVRSTTQTDKTEHHGEGESLGVLDESTWVDCEKTIASVFGNLDAKGESQLDPKSLVKALSDNIGSSREQWPTTLLRRLWEALIDHESGRRLSPQHESRWLNLVGFCLRPGYGLALDDWRVTESWRMIYKKLVHSGASQRNELLILWRRIAGGLTRGQQLTLAEPLLSSLRSMAQVKSGKPKKGSVSTALRPEESLEVWRLIGSLELISTDQKGELGDLILQLLQKPKFEKARLAMVWALGRLGQRRPLYGPLNTVLPAETVSRWLQQIMDRSPTGDKYFQGLSDAEKSSLQLAVVQMARRTDDRYRDLSLIDRESVARWLQESGAKEHLISLVVTGGSLDMEEQGQVFGESLPLGLRLE